MLIPLVPEVVRQTLAAAAVAVLAATAPAQATGAPDAAGSWTKVARQLTMPVFKPTKTFGLRLGFVNRITFDPGCANDGRDQLRAFYGHQSGRFLEVFEGHPRYCGDAGIGAPVARTLRIHGAPARLYHIGGTRRALDWCERGTTITLVSEGLSASRLIAIGRSMRPVDSAKPLACPA